MSRGVACNRAEGAQLGRLKSESTEVLQTFGPFWASASFTI